MLRHATIADVPEIARLISHFAGQGKMLFRSHAELYETLRDFTVFEAPDSPGRIAGVCALEIVWADMAELKSLAVTPSCHGRGIGRQLVETVLQEARDLKIQRVFALTYEPDFFKKMGFYTVDREALPLKVWSDCAKCPKRDGCDEIAMVMDVLPRAVESAEAEQAEHGHYDVPSRLVSLNLPPHTRPAAPGYRRAGKMG